jgi:hypothetical protein
LVVNEWNDCRKSVNDWVKKCVGNIYNFVIDIPIS